MIQPPKAEKKPHELKIHDDIRNDEWYWLNDKDNPDVLALLASENEYTSQQTAATEPLQKTLYEEYLSRIEQTDDSVPAKRDNYWYFTRTIEGSQYAVHCRREGTGEE